MDVIDPDVALTYLEFVAQRHRAWEARQRGDAAPWCDDPIVRSRKFTNVYRVLDHGSQFLVRELLDPDLSPRDTLARCFLFRYTNLPATWEHVRAVRGRYPLEKDLDQVLCDTIITRRDEGQKVFSGAYMILPQPNRKGDKVVQAVRLANDFMENHSADFLEAGDQATRHQVLTSLYGVGDFLAMQILTDFGYSVHSGYDREDEFVVPGPGSTRGAQAIDPDAAPLDTIMWAVNAVRTSPDCPMLSVPSGHRWPSWMDIQNTLCEFSKYVRFQGKRLSTVPYAPAHPGPQEPPVLPSHW